MKTEDSLFYQLVHCWLLSQKASAAPKIDKEPYNIPLLARCLTDTDPLLQEITIDMLRHLANQPINRTTMIKEGFVQHLASLLAVTQSGDFRHNINQILYLLDYVIPLNEIRILKTIGEGNFSTVFVAHYDFLGANPKTVAIKQYKTPEITEKYLAHEMRIAQKLHHPNIIECYGRIMNGLVMEYAVSGCLRTHLDNQGPLSHHLLVRIMLGVIDAIAYIHELDIIHRDIKSENILISDDFSPKLADFGFALFTKEPPKRITRSGSLDWMAPELIDPNRKIISKAADIWAFGMTLFEMKSGTFPWRYAITEEQIKSCILSGKGERIPTAWMETDRYLVMIMQACWQEYKNRPAAPIIAEACQRYVEATTIQSPCF